MVGGATPACAPLSLSLCVVGGAPQGLLRSHAAPLPAPRSNCYDKKHPIDPSVIRAAEELGATWGGPCKNNNCRRELLVPCCGRLLAAESDGQIAAAMQLAVAALLHERGLPPLRIQYKGTNKKALPKERVADLRFVLKKLCARNQVAYHEQTRKHEDDAYEAMFAPR